MDGPEYIKYKQDYYSQLHGWTGDQLAPEHILNPSELINYNAGITNDWQDIVFQNALSNRHTVSINGGTEYTQYTATVSNLSQEGVMKNTGLRRTNVSLNVVQDLNFIMDLEAYNNQKQSEISNRKSLFISVF